MEWLLIYYGFTGQMTHDPNQMFVTMHQFKTKNQCVVTGQQIAENSPNYDRTLPVGGNADGWMFYHNAKFWCKKIRVQ